MNRIVVADPSGRTWPGSLVSEEKALSLKARGVVLLPCDPKLFTISGVGGYAKREWGSGWPIEAPTPRMFSPLTLLLTPDERRIHWAVRLMPVNPHGGTLEETRAKMAGTISFATDQTQHGSRTVPGLFPDDGCRQLHPRDLAEPDAHGGWTWTGQAGITVNDTALYGFAIYGAASGLRLVWAAVSATAE